MESILETQESFDTLERELLIYERVLEAQPNNHEAWRHRSYLLGHLGRYQAAIASYEKTLALTSSQSD
ncbi:MAG: tetratricopeptide repeat protein, partial [Cyanobacteria bacterium J06659_2]